MVVLVSDAAVSHCITGHENCFLKLINFTDNVLYEDTILTLRVFHDFLFWFNIFRDGNNKTFLKIANILMNRKMKR